MRLKALTVISPTEEFPGISSGDIEAARSCAARVKMATKRSPMLAVIGGYIRVIDRKWIEGTK